MRLTKEELAALADECRRKASEKIRPLGRPDVEEDLLEVPIAFRNDPRDGNLGFCEGHGKEHLAEVIVYPRRHRTREDLVDTVMHELAHQVVEWMRPDEGIWHSNGGGIFGHVMALFGHGHPEAYWKDMDYRCGFREVRKGQKGRRR